MTTFLSITNEVLRRLNEVQLDTNEFTSARNVQALAKDAVNSSIREILQNAQEWYFTLETSTQTCAVGQGTYTFPADFSKADWDTFYIQSLNEENNASWLPLLTYDEYVKYHKAREEMSGEGGYDTPTNVYMTQGQGFGLTPKPKSEYIIEYRYWKFPPDLILPTDVLIIPERFKHVVIDGAMMYMMQFRSNDQNYTFYKEKFNEGIKIMRRLVEDYPVRVNSTVLNYLNVSKVISDA
jgi:hypothetical protein